MQKWVFIPAFILLMVPVKAFSEESNVSSESLSLLAEEKMIFTPSRHLQPIDHSPSTISIITSEEIQSSGATNIPELLRRIPGMEVAETTAAEYNVSIRGDNQLLANKLLVMIDGRSVHEELENLVFWNSFPIGLNEIERIEIIRGPGSAIWGANAFDGVVNIISKTPSDLNGTKLTFSGGEIGSARVDMIHAGERGPIDYKVSIGYQRGNEWRDGGTLAEEVYRSNFLIQHQFDTEKKMSFSGGFSDTPRYDGPLFDNGIGFSDLRQGYLQGGYEDPFSFFHVYWNNFNYKTSFYLFSPDPNPAPYALNPLLYLPDPALNYSFDLYHIEGQRQLFAGSTHQIIAGINYRMTDIRGELIGGRHQIQLIGGYLQDEWTPLESLTLVLGGRYDDHDFQSMHQYFVSPRVSLLYRFPSAHQLIRISYGEAYRPPTPLELFQVNIAGSPSPFLNPERISSYEAGYSALFLEQLKTEITLYDNRLTDLIDIQGNPISNLTRSEMYGGEAGGELLITRKLKVFANYAYQEIHQSLEGIPFPNSAIRAGPTQKINGGGKISFHNGLFTQMQVHYVTKVHFPPTFLVGQVVPTDTSPYTLVNLQAGYQLWNDKLDLILSIFNLLHDHHREYPLGDEIGNRITGQLNLNLD